MKKTDILILSAAAMLAWLPTLARAQSAPDAGSIAVQVKNEGPGSTTYWIGPGSPPVLQGIAAGGAPSLFSLGSGLSIVEGALTLGASSFGLTLLDDADAATARTTLELGTLATQSATITDYLTTAAAASTYAALAGSYSDPAWITALAWSKITGAPSFLTGNQTITLSGDVTGSGTTAITTTLANSGVTAATYFGGGLTVDAKGRVTAATNILTDNLYFEDSWGGATTIGHYGLAFIFGDESYELRIHPESLTQSFNLILPPSPGTAGQALVIDSVDGETFRLGFASPSGSGTVTSVAVSGSDGVQVDSGSPLTSSGTIALGIDASALSSHLGLGGAALLGVGTVAGTVAAGDDARFHTAVTLAGTPDYLTVSGQEITRGLIDLSTDVTGSLPWASVSKTGSSLADLATRSAADLSSGTLDAARLPAPTTTTLGGVKRNTGSEGQFVTGINTDGELTYDTPEGGGGGGTTIYGPAPITSDVVSTSDSTWSDIASIFLAANTRYELELGARHSSAVGATGPAFGVDVNVTPADYLASVTAWTALAASSSGTATASGEVLSIASGTTTPRDVLYKVNITTGGSATTLKFQVKINGGDSGTVTLEEPIYIDYHEVTAP